MNLLFAGSPSLAVPSLETIARSHNVVGVLTGTDQPSGRGRQPVAPEVKKAALALGLPVFQPQRLDAAFREAVRALSPDLLVVVAFGRIFSASFLGLFPMGGINLHPSLLPRYRGPSPVSAAILAGDAETGVTVQLLAERFDTGDILAQEPHPLRGDETTAALGALLGARGARLLGSVLAGLSAGRAPRGTAQREEEASYCHVLRKEDGVVRWDEPAEAIERKIRAFDPWPRASTTLAGETLLLLKSHVYPDTLGRELARGRPGEVLSTDRSHGLLVRTGRGILSVERLQLQFKKPLDWRSFLNGHPGLIGAYLGAGAEVI